MSNLPATPIALVIDDEPQIRRFREIERQYQQASIPQADEQESTMVLRDNPKP